MAKWKISGRQAACSICSHEFEDGERHHSMVAFLEDQVQRGDYCQACWDKGGIELQLAEPMVESGSDVPETSEGTSSAEPPTEIPVDEIPVNKPHRFWWTTRHQAKPPKTLQMDMDALLRLFLELSDREETKLRELRFVLCLLLMRKKRVKLERILRDDDGESFIVRRPKSEDRYTVEVFDITPERSSEVREHLQAIFDGIDGDESLAQAARGEEVDPVEEAPLASDTAE